MFNSVNLSEVFYPLNIWFFTGMKADEDDVFSQIKFYLGSGEQKYSTS